MNDNIERTLKNGKIVKGISKRYVLGDYHRTDFNVKAIEKKISDLRSEYGSKNSLTWDEISSELGLKGEVAQRMFRNTHENKVNANRKARSTWDVISVIGRADTRSAESFYLNKKLTPQTAELMDEMNDEWAKVNKLRLVKK